VLNASIQGQRVSKILGRIHNSHLVDGFAGLPSAMGVAKVGFGFLKGGTNDARAMADWPSISATYTSLVTAMLVYCEHVIICTIPPIILPEDDAEAKDACVRSINAGLAAFAAANPGTVTLIDGARFLRAGASPTGAGISAYFTDGVHPNHAGVHVQGVGEGEALATALAARGWAMAAPLVTDNADVYPATRQWATNPGMIGSVPHGGAWPGTVANGVTVGASGAGAGTVFMLAADPDDPNQQPWQMVAPTQGQSSGWTQVSIANAGAQITATEPSRVEAMVELRFDALDLRNIKRLTFAARGNTTNNRYLLPRFWLGLGPQAMTWTRKGVVMRSRLPRAAGTIESGITLFLALEYTASFSGASMGSFGFRFPSLRG
jgi:hypothetical protein